MHVFMRIRVHVQQGVDKPMWAHLCVCAREDMLGELQVCVCMHVEQHTRMSMYIHVCRCAEVGFHMHISVCACAVMCAHPYVCVHIYMLTHTCFHADTCGCSPRAAAPLQGVVCACVRTRVPVQLPLCHAAAPQPVPAPCSV